MAETVATSSSESTRHRVRKHREELRAKGLRPVTRWVPDTRSAEFQAEYRRQRAVLAERARANPEAEAEFWDWADALQATDGWV
jgi:predicted RNA-binding protein